jgi:hypothetical protein
MSHTYETPELLQVGAMQHVVLGDGSSIQPDNASITANSPLPLSVLDFD